ncbi:hypothetical protein ACHAXN_007667 [Cyclotella atomus]
MMLVSLLLVSSFAIAACFVASPSRSSLNLWTTLRLQGSSYLDSLSTNAQRANTAYDVSTQQDPYTPGVADFYGLATSTTQDGFDAAADTVGPSIYGGSVQRHANGSVIYTFQYEENDHHRPGPVYDGNGYSIMSRAIHFGPEKVRELLNDYPQLINEVSTGGATPLHVCGMSEKGQLCTQTLVDSGADIHALDSYNYNALHRMASNNLDIGAEVLVKAGIDPNSKVEEADSTPIEIAKRQRAIKFLMAMQRLGRYD